MPVDHLTLLFVNAPTFSSRLIRAIERTEASHCGVLRPDGTVVDSTFLHRGVRAWQRDEWMQGRTLIAEVAFPVRRLDDGMGWLDMQIGKPYDWTALAGWLLWLDWQQDDSWYCSELAIACAQACGRSVPGSPRRIGLDAAMKLAGAWADVG